MEIINFGLYQIIEAGQGKWIIPASKGMRVPGKVFANRSMIQSLIAEKGGLEQVINVAHLPGILGDAIGLPDIHWGYAFPIGGGTVTSGACSQDSK